MGPPLRHHHRPIDTETTIEQQISAAKVRQDAEIPVIRFNKPTSSGSRSTWLMSSSLDMLRLYHKHIQNENLSAPVSPAILGLLRYDGMNIVLESSRLTLYAIPCKWSLWWPAREDPRW
jgi:hypothetical protein